MIAELVTADSMTADFMIAELVTADSMTAVLMITERAGCGVAA